MQPKNKPRRRTLVAGVSLFAILIAIGFLAWERSRDQQDKPPSANSNTSLSDPAQQAELYPVTILVVDYFSPLLTELVNDIDRRADPTITKHFSTTGDEIRAIRAQPGRSGPDIREEIISKMGQLKDDIDPLVQKSELMNLGTRAFASTNCAVSPEGTSVFSTEGASVFSTEGASVFSTDGASVSVTKSTAMSAQLHGVRVENEVQELLKLPQTQGLAIQVDTLDIQGFAFPAIADDLDKKIAAIRAANPDMRIVVNMSFAIVPCQKVTDLAAYTRLLREFVIEEGGGHPNDPWAFEQVLGALYQEDIFHTTPAVVGTFQSEFCPDGEDTAACVEYPPGQEEPPSTDRTLYFVAASGNGIKENGKSLGVEYPFYPAAWKEVIAVSANNDSDHLALAQDPPADYSNPGRIMMAGSWLPDPAFWQNQPDQDWQYGTSFAAPRYSFIVALYLTGSPGSGVGCDPDVFPPPADSFDWNVAPPPPDKVNKDHCSTLHP